MNVDDIKSEFQLLATSLLKLDHNNNFVRLNEDMNIEKMMEVSYEINDITKIEKEDLLMGTITLNVISLIKYNDSEMSINLDLQGCFISEKPEDIDGFKVMLGLNGCASLYSIARSMILSISSQACIGAQIMLPMINVFKLNGSDVVETEKPETTVI